MRTVHILQIGDMQKGFTHEDGNLYVRGARDIIDPANDFLRQVKGGYFNYTFIILDTHFPEEYRLSEEAKEFPLHCEFGTPDWELTVDISGLPNRRYLMKNQFNLWSDKPLPDIRFSDSGQQKVHDNLFHFLDSTDAPSFRIKRDEFIASLQHNDDVLIDVTLLGVASDYCTRFAMEGWLARGARVTILEDLTKGIRKETAQVLDEYRCRQYTSDRLRSVQSTDYLDTLRIAGN